MIAVDGPAASGKGTVAAGVARRSASTCSTAARCIGWWRSRRCEPGIPLDDEDRLAAAAAALDVDFGDGGVLLDGEDVTDAIRSRGGVRGRLAGRRLPAVRAALFGAPARLPAPPGLVADGRDMGTVVFPDAALKVFVTASPRNARGGGISS